ncbi:MAG: YlxR family protein [Eubacteriales bacterium]
MKNKKIPIRMCVACRSPLPKKEMLRIVKTTEGLKLDLTGKMPGRGAYICSEIECLERAKKINAFEHALEGKLTEELFAEIRRAILRRRINLDV